ncbi:hypothetical protein [Lichenifustis flavocetrariae]|uniref:Uncharacterized protein n=1 Tax=Lichenifustis flavocetrariae TaxID=2949735 RepID=A0AA41Z227_9HYPH|nr:hypothetical protein [Lichenifustis flavocetrariae]MCW6509068.1 hypothetical protein [Lichenifustis flavocetrariae]
MPRGADSTSPERLAANDVVMIDPDLASILTQFAIAYGCMLVIPGPNAIVVLQSSGERSALKPITAAAGVATGATLAAAVAASSAAALPQGAGIRIAGSVLVATIMFRAALRLYAFARSKPVLREPPAHRSCVEPFLLGLAAAALHPLSVPYFAAFFLSHACTRIMMVLSCCTVFLMAGLWFASLGLVASKLRNVAWPPFCRRSGGMAAAVVLAALASRSLWLAISP